MGQAGLTSVWAAIEAGEMADQPAQAGGTAETDPAGASAPDWRALLDLIETRTGKDVTDLWRTWVVRPDEAALLDRRATVRADYRSLVAAAGEWAVPMAIRLWAPAPVEAISIIARDGMKGRKRRMDGNST